VSAIPQTEDIGHRPVSRAPLQESLRGAEEQTLGELGVVRESLGRAVEAVTTGETAIAEELAAGAAERERRYGEVHDCLLALMARQAPVAGDLRLATALLHVNDRVERMGAQCVNIATLCRAFPKGGRPSSGQLECLSAMARLADEQVAEAARVFTERDIEGARRLVEHDLGINEQNRRCFALAVREGDDEVHREVAFLVALMARAIERIGDNAVDIGRQAAFAATGRLRTS
jgi:phosphate transport system protein